jgi:hypothetical protein
MKIIWLASRLAVLEDDEYKDRSPDVVLLTAGQPPARS